MASPDSRPRLRPIEVIVVPDPRSPAGRAVMIRDTQGVATAHAVLPLAFLPILTRFTGGHTCEDVAAYASEQLGEEVPVDLVVRLATELEEGCFAFGEPYKKARARVEKEFADADVRPASHAGGAYHGDPKKLADYIDSDCFGAAAPPGDLPKGRLWGLVAPHIDPWRGARGYGEAYGVLGRSIPKDADTFVLVGTSHAPMRQPFALCRKAFATPLGPMEADTASIDLLAGACDFDPYADQFNHKREHSLEFQAVFLKHLLGDGRAPRKAKIIPILCGLGEQQSNGDSPTTYAQVEKFFEALRGIVDDKGAVVVAGADMAHVGPRFGDAEPLDARGRAALEQRDRESLALATSREPEGFWSHVTEDLDDRRVCGLAPIYSLLRVIPKSATGTLRHYEQNVDPEEGSIVSHAALGFHG